MNGIRSVIGKGFHAAIKEYSPDIVMLQEVKAEQHQAPLALDNYHIFWNAAQKKGYSGTATFSKHKPLSYSYGMNKAEHDTEGRMITLEFPLFYLINVYTPNSKHELLRLDYRLTWERDFLNYIQKLEEKKPVIIGGDLNVAHTEIDLEHPHQNHFNPGFSDGERQAFSTLLSAGYLDTFRMFHKEPKHYSWWPYKFHCRERNIGWRIDYFVGSKKLKNELTSATILPHVVGSDHCPVTLELRDH